MRSLSTIVLLCCASLYSYAQQETTGPDPAINTGNKIVSCCSDGNCCNGGQTPIGVTTDHIHPKGEWMALYTYMDMRMMGNRTGTAKTNDDAIYDQGYMMSPTNMAMHMHMAMLMYGVTNRLTLMAMGGYTTFSMGMSMNTHMAVTMPGMSGMATSMSSTSSGLADTKVSALYSFSKKAGSRLIGSLGINLPTGSITATGTTMLGVNQRMPYDMQPGSGSFSVLPDLTYIRQLGKLALGANAGADVKLNNNSIGYRLGNVYHATAWASYRLLSFMSASVRGEALTVDKLRGSDPQVAIPIYEEYDPTTSTGHYGGSWGNVYAGLNFHVNRPVLKNFQIDFEYGMPVYENLNGPQMSVHSTFYAGLQYRF